MPNNFFDTYDWNRAAQGLFIPPNVYGNAQSQAARAAWRQAHPFGPPRAPTSMATTPPTTTPTPTTTTPTTPTPTIGVKPNPFTPTPTTTTTPTRAPIQTALSTGGIGVKPNPFTPEPSPVVVDNTDEYARNAIAAAMVARDDEYPGVHS